jgi:hypothetical protein
LDLAHDHIDMQETTPLLNKTPRPLPKAQLAIVFLVLCCEIVNFTVIFPFIAEALLHFNIAREDAEIAFYAGAVESTFFARVVGRESRR